MASSGMLPSLGYKVSFVDPELCYFCEGVAFLGALPDGITINVASILCDN